MKEFFFEKKDTIFFLIGTYLLYHAFFRDSENKPPMAGPNKKLVPLRNNAAGKMSGLEVILKNLNLQYFPIDNRGKGYNVRNVLSGFCSKNKFKHIKVYLEYLTAFTFQGQLT